MHHISQDRGKVLVHGEIRGKMQQGLCWAKSDLLLLVLEERNQIQVAKMASVVIGSRYYTHKAESVFRTPPPLAGKISYPSAGHCRDAASIRFFEFWQRNAIVLETVDDLSRKTEEGLPAEVPDHVDVFRPFLAAEVRCP